MDLSDRKQKILQAIIDEYIGTAEPVGSRAISKNEKVGFSSATIRNEMADLEDMGYLVKPHTSAGRIPSDSGYRFYVNSLMNRYQMSVEAIEQLRRALEGRVSRLDILLKKASMITSALTQYTTVVTSPTMGSITIRKIDFVSMGGQNIMLVLITNRGLVKNKFIKADIGEDKIEMLSRQVNDILCGMSNNEITQEKVLQIGKFILENIHLSPDDAANITNSIYELIYEIGETEVYINNARAILSYPEFSDISSARKMLNFFENKENLIKMIGPASGSGELNIKIGTENEFEELENSSLITVDYKKGKNAIGRIGVIGPKRMNYAKVIASLDCISEQIDSILEQLYNIGEEV